MAKEKQTRRMIAMALAAAVTMSSVPVVAFAEDGGSTVTNNSGESGSGESGGGESGGGEPASAKAPESNIPEVKPNEKPVANDGPIDVTITIPSQPDDPTTPDVDEGTKNETFGDPVGTPDGDLPEDENDKTYDYTVVTGQGSVTVETTENTGAVKEYEQDDLDYIASETAPTDSNDLVTEKIYNTPEEYLPGNQVGTPLDPDGPAEGEDWHQYEYVGTGNSSQYRPLVVFTEPMSAEDKIREYGDHPADGAYINNAKALSYFVGRLSPEEKEKIAKNEDDTYKTDENGYLLDINGNRVLKPEQTMTGPDGETYYLRRFDRQGNSAEGWYNDADWKDTDGDGEVDTFVPGEWLTELNGKDKHAAPWREAAQFVLVDKVTGEIITTYCADTFTQTEKNFGYHIENLEDAAYYTEEEAAMIRSIAANGYWGTVGYEEVQKKDENGNPVFEMVIDEVTGESVLKLDEETGEPIPVMEQKAKAGSLEAMKVMLKEAGFTDKELESLTDGVALAATQMAIWSCSNKMAGVEFINANYYLTPDVTEAPAESFGAGDNIPVDKEDEVKLMFKLYDYLKNLAPTSIPDEEKTTADTIINAGNFLDGDMEITVLEKAKDHENNQDKDDTNDAYKANLSFALVVKPSTENGDDLVVSVVDDKGRVVAKGRVAGDNSADDSSFTDITDHGDGNYTFNGITMIEGGQVFNITMDGIQNLKEGVYLYTSEVVLGDQEGQNDETTSQTMVGMAGGSHSVNVTQTLKFSFDVEDEKVVVRERHSGSNKHKDKDKGKEEVYIPNEDVPLTDIPDEEIPLVEGEDVVVIVDEDVPMGEVVLGDEEVSVIAQTGDSNRMTGAFGGMLAALAGMFMLRKKKEN